MNVEIMLTRLTTRQRYLHIHAYPNYQTLFTSCGAIDRTSKIREPKFGLQLFGN